MDNLQAQQKLVTSAWIDDVDTVMIAIRGFTRRRRLQNDCRVVLFELSGDRDLHVNVTHDHHTASPAGWSGPGIVADGFVHNRRFGRAESREIADHIHEMVFAPRQRAAAARAQANSMMAAPRLHEFVTVHRDEIIRRCQQKVAMRTIPLPTEAEMNHGVPLFLDQLVDALNAGGMSSAAIGRGALVHGHDLLLKGFTVSQVVHDYGDVCQSITDLAIEREAPISAEDFRTLNACLDDAIAIAVTQYARERDKTNADGEALRGTERLGFFAHELRNLLNTALLAFEAIRSGRVAVAGSTGMVLHRSLTAAESLISRSLAEVRLTQGIQNREPIDVASFVSDVAPAATLAADVRRIMLTVDAVEPGLRVEADRQVLTAVLMNLLQNAIKFTRPGTGIVLRVGGSEERVLIEVEDQCGGLPVGETDELFRAFEQRGANRTGLGLGLAFSRWGIEANRGRVYARNIPGSGCVFTIDLPRLHAMAVAAGC